MSSSLTSLIEFANQMLTRLPADVLVDLDADDRDLLKGRILIHSIQHRGRGESVSEAAILESLEQSHLAAFPCTLERSSSR